MCVMNSINNSRCTLSVFDKFVCIYTTESQLGCRHMLWAPWSPCNLGRSNRTSPFATVKTFPCIPVCIRQWGRYYCSSERATLCSRYPGLQDEYLVISGQCLHILRSTECVHAILVKDGDSVYLYSSL